MSKPDHLSIQETLILEVFKQADGLKAGLFQQGEILPALRHYSQLGLSFGEVSNLCAEMIGILNGPVRAGSGQQDKLREIQKIGKLLWDHLFSGQIKEKLKNRAGCVLTLSLDEELI